LVGGALLPTALIAKTKTAIKGGAALIFDNKCEAKNNH